MKKKIAIDIDEIANECGIKFIRCDPSWGGTWAFTEEARKGNNQVTIAGYRTKKAALRGWFESELGDQLGQLLLKRYFIPKY